MNRIIFKTGHVLMLSFLILPALLPVAATTTEDCQQQVIDLFDATGQASFTGPWRKRVPRRFRLNIRLGITWYQLNRGYLDSATRAATAYRDFAQAFVDKGYLDLGEPPDPDLIGGANALIECIRDIGAAENFPPVADAGPNQTVHPVQLVRLDAVDSADIDGDLLSYAWALTLIPVGSTATLSDPAAVTPTFTADMLGTYIAELIVNDGTVDSSPDRVQVDTFNSAPVADAGLDQTVQFGELVQLDGIDSFDVDNDPLTYSWVMTSKPAGSVAALVSPDTSGPSFTPDLFGNYTMSLIVNDGFIDSDSQIVVVTVEPGFCAAAVDFDYEDQLNGVYLTLSAWVQEISPSGSVTINGIDSSRPTIPFTFDWGDNTETTGWFAQMHTYSDPSKNYVVKVVAHYSNGTTSEDLVLVRFKPPEIVKMINAPALAVSFPNENIILGTRLYTAPVLSHFDDSFFSLVSREVVEYVLTVAASYQYEYMNRDLFMIDGGFNQVVLLDPNLSGGMYSLWFTNPVAFGAGTSAFSGTPGYSSFFHEMGHNVTLNTPADYYYGGRIDGSANAIFSETMAQIVAHVTAYDVVNQGPAAGLSCDLIFEIRQDALRTARFIRQQFDAYVGAGMPFASWNNPSTPADETFGTFMTLAYVFLSHAQSDGNGFAVPLQRMMVLLQNADNVSLLQSWQYADHPLGDETRATLMAAAISYAFETDLSGEFQALNFPVNTVMHDQLYDAAP